MTPDEFLRTLHQGEPSTADEAALPFRCERLGCVLAGTGCAKRHRKAQAQKARWRPGRPRRRDDVRNFECIDCEVGALRLRLLADGIGAIESGSVMGRYASRRRRRSAPTYRPPPCTYCGRARKRTTRPPDDPLHEFCSVCQFDARRRLRNQGEDTGDAAIVEVLLTKVAKRAAKEGDCDAA